MERLSESIGRVLRVLRESGDRPWAAPLLFVFAVCEATIFPAPSEALLLALCISAPRRWWRFAALAVLGSVLGALAAYVVGARMFADVGAPLLRTFGLLELLPKIEAVYRENMLLALVTSGYTPIPYLLYTMAAGAFALPLDTFVVGSAAGRALKYFPIAVAAMWLGRAAGPYLARHAGRAMIVVSVALVLLIVWKM